MWTIQFPEESRIIGFAGFRDFFDPPRPQLLYGLFPELCGQGLATEAAWQLCDHAFSRLGFSRIEAATDRPNEKSIAVLVRLGMLPMTASNQMPDATLFYEIEHGRWRWRELNVAARKPQSTKVSLTQESLKQ